MKHYQLNMQMIQFKKYIFSSDFSPNSKHWHLPTFSGEIYWITVSRLMLLLPGSIPWSAGGFQRFQGAHSKSMSYQLPWKPIESTIMYPSNISICMPSDTVEHSPVNQSQFSKCPWSSNTSFGVSTCLYYCPEKCVLLLNSLATKWWLTVANCNTKI